MNRLACVKLGGGIVSQMLLRTWSEIHEGTKSEVWWHYTIIPLAFSKLTTMASYLKLIVPFKYQNEDSFLEPKFHTTLTIRLLTPRVLLDMSLCSGK